MAALETLALVDDPCFDGHRPEHPHPERPERLDAARDGLRGAVGADRLRPIEAPEASLEDLAHVHGARYLSDLDAALRGGHGHLDPDTYFGPGSREAAWRAAGGARALSDALLAEERCAGIALLRPPGHHARPNRPMGFCLLNNVAVAAASALARGAERVAIVDWDVHHGNGTQEMFFDDPRVLFVSLHQWPFYPGTGQVLEVGGPHARGSTINVPLPAGSGPEAYGEAFRRLVLPALRHFDPSLVLVSAGFDAHARDPLAELELDADTFGAMASSLVEEHPRVGLLLEGGYDLQAIETSMGAVARALLGARTELPHERVRGPARESLEEALAVHGRFWPVAPPD